MLHFFPSISISISPSYYSCFCCFEERIESISQMDPHLSPTRSEELVWPRTMKDYALPTIRTQPSAILLDQASRNYELKSFHFNMLPSYYGRQDEDALQFMKDYCFMLEIFPFSSVIQHQFKVNL